MVRPTKLPNPERLSASEAKTAIVSGRLDSLGLVRACLERIGDREKEIHAWTHVERQESLRRAEALDRLGRSQPLHGIPVAVKDVIDTAGMPTAYGSPIYAGNRPKADAACVRKLTAAGAIILGKTVTTEFAYFAPGPTHNPHMRGYTPGGSSSGSAAAVADFHVPIALGTQTAGSVIRPAAYCGVVGYKGTYGWADMAGVKPLSPALDTLGVLCRSVADLALVRQAFVGKPQAKPGGLSDRPLRVAVCRTPYWTEADADMHGLFEDVVEKMRGHAEIVDFDPDETWDALNDAQLTIMMREAAAALARERADHEKLLSSRLREMLADGEKIGIRDETAARALATRCRNRLAQVWRDSDLILAPAAPGAAPRGLERTGDPVFNRMWTLLGNPCIALPAGRNDRGLPLAIQLVGPHNEDDSLVAHAARLETLLTA
ncbi:MAG: amidase [Alphaproteobacteria bacterium]|nr:amidase [Alphaproteobacteria bacterium]